MNVFTQARAFNRALNEAYVSFSLRSNMEMINGYSTVQEVESYEAAFGKIQQLCYRVIRLFESCWWMTL